MAENDYKVIGFIGTSTGSWEKATAAALAHASKALRDLRVAQVVKLECNEEGQGGSVLNLENKPLAQTSAGVTTYLHTDELGSPIAATNASGAWLWYQPYGLKLNDVNEKIGFYRSCV